MHGWSEDIIKTVSRWSTVLTRLSEIYDKKADQNRIAIRRFKTIILFIGLISMVVGLLQINESSLEYRIMLIITTSLSELVTGYMTIANYDSKLEKFSTYNEKIKIFIGEISTQMSLPYTHRINGNSFIKDNAERYQKILIEKPNLLGKDMNYSDLEKDNNIQLHLQKPDIHIVSEV